MFCVFSIKVWIEHGTVSSIKNSEVLSHRNRKLRVCRCVTKATKAKVKAIRSRSLPWPCIEIRAFKYPFSSSLLHKHVIAPVTVHEWPHQFVSSSSRRSLTYLPFYRKRRYGEYWSVRRRLCRHRPYHTERITEHPGVGRPEHVRLLRQPRI